MLEFYKNKKVFITGHTGFKGTWLCRILLLAGSNVTGYALKASTNPSLFELSQTSKDINSIIADIRNKDELETRILEFQPDIVLHLAAQPGEGGAVYTKSALLNRIIRSFRDWGRDCYCPSGKDDTCRCRFSKQYGKLPLGFYHKYTYSHFGYNLKATDMQAAIGCAQLGKLDSFTKKRERISLI